MHEHKRAIRQADFNASPLAEHVWTEQHQVDWSNVVVVSNPRDHTIRLIEETLTYQEHDKCIEQGYWLFAFWV